MATGGQNQVAATLKKAARAMPKGRRSAFAHFLNRLQAWPKAAKRRAWWK